MNQYCYVALHDCGGWQGVTVDAPDHKRENSKYLSQWLKAGLTIERITCDQFRNTMKMCKCDKKQGKLAL